MTDRIDQAPSRKIEFVCERCLFAVYALDTDPVPTCPRGHGRLTPDCDEPAARAISIYSSSSAECHSFVEAV
jgi:hypothetical protein